MSRALYQIDHRAAVKRLHGWLAQADASTMARGASWYPDAFREASAMSEASGFNVETCAAVISHLSPQTRWEDNVRHAWHTLTNDEGTRPSACLGDCHARALRAMHSPTPLETFGKRALKTKAFARAILGDTDAVVIDTWAVRAALADGRGFRDGTVDDMSKILRRTGVYDQVADAYRTAAASVRLPATALQAIVWGVIRGSFD